MASKGQVVWRGNVQMGQNCIVYGNKVIEAVTAVANYFAPIMETAAKKHAPWTDRTSNARVGLHAWVEEFSKDAVHLYLAHSVFYGQFLETRWAGRFSVIWPEIQAHLEPIMEMLKGIFG